MEEAWERAVEAKLEGMATPSSELRVLNLDGAVKSLHGCLPPAELLERFPGLEHLSIANVGVTSLERFPRLRNLRRLILSDNRIAGGLESLVDAGLQSLRDFDLSNNRIQHIEDLAPLAALHLVSLDLYECPVTRVKDYRSKVFSMIRTLKYLDKLDANENERPETDEEEEEEDEEEEYDDDEEDSWNGEVDGGDQNGKLISDAGNSVDGDEGIVDADDDEGSDADEEEIETNGRRTASGSSGGSGHHLSNGFRVSATSAAFVARDEHDGDGDDVEEDDDDDDLGEEIDEDEADYEDDAAEMLAVLDSDEEDEDGLDEAEVDEEEIDEDGDDDEEVDEDDDEEDAEPASTGRLASAEGEIDGHDHGEEDENGEIGEEDDEQAVDDRDAEEDDYGESEDEDDLDDKYLMQPIARSSRPDSSVVGNEDDEIDYEDDNRPNTGTLNQASSSAPCKRRRDEKGHLEEEEDEDDDDETEEMKPSKRR